jgi:hypothetical protein
VAKVCTMTRMGFSLPYKHILHYISANVTINIITSDKNRRKTNMFSTNLGLVMLLFNGHFDMNVMPGIRCISLCDISKLSKLSNNEILNYRYRYFDSLSVHPFEAKSSKRSLTQKIVKKGYF